MGRLRRANFNTATLEEPEVAEGEEILEELDLDQLDEVYDETIAAIEDQLEAGEISQEEAEELAAEAGEDYLNLAGDEEEIEYDDKEALAILGELDEDELEDVFEQTIGDIDDLEAEGELSADEAQALREEAVGDLEYLLGLDAEGYPEEEDYDDEEILAEGEDILGELDGDEIVEILNVTLDDIQEAYEAGEIDEDEFEALSQDAVAEAEEYVGPLLEDESYQEDVEAENYRRRVDQMEAQFTAAQEAQFTSDRLTQLERDAQVGIQEGWLPPVIYNDVFAEFENDRDRFAAFSTVCQRNNVTADVELYKMEGIIDSFRRCADMGAPLMTFGIQSNEPELSPEEEAEQDNALAQARRNVRTRLGV